MKPDFFFYFSFIFAPGVRVGWEEGHAKNHSPWRTRVRCSSSFGAQNAREQCSTLKYKHETSVLWQMPPWNPQSSSQ